MMLEHFDLAKLMPCEVCVACKMSLHFAISTAFAEHQSFLRNNTDQKFVLAQGAVSNSLEFYHNSLQKVSRSQEDVWPCVLTFQQTTENFFRSMLLWL